MNTNEIEINGELYIKKNTIAEDAMGDYVIVRTYSAGVFAGYIKSMDNNGRHVVMHNARRIWYWDGAASLSQLAMEGTTKPEQCKFPCEVDRVELMEVIEILNTTKKAENSIKSVVVWKQ